MANTLGTNLHVVDPAPGRWTLVIDFAPTVSGNALTEGYSVRLNDRRADAQAFGLDRRLSAHQCVEPRDPRHPR